MKALILIELMAIGLLASSFAAGDISAFKGELPAGYVKGDIVSYSYVPNKYWSRKEAIGIMPYVWEYALMKHQDGVPLETFHKENIRRIDMVSQWSTAIELYARKIQYRDEIINLMIRAFKHRQLIILRDYINIGTSPEKKAENPPLANSVAILDKLWENRDKKLRDPEGDKATGQQLINNILAIKLGDEGLPEIKTDGLYEMNRVFREKIKDRVIDGKKPFSHIKSWYNEIHYPIGSYAANKEDLAKRRYKWPANSEFIGVDVYHYWGFQYCPFDPDDPKVTRKQVQEQARSWQNVITRYYGPSFKVRLGSGWDPAYNNDTHAMMQAIDLAGARQAMMIFIANSDYNEGNYTTPIETMDAFYESLKAGPWVGLSWWVFDWTDHETSTLGYLDGKLKHYTPDHPEGIAYTDRQLKEYRRRLIESRKRIFHDVVYRQFGYLNGPGKGLR